MEKAILELDFHLRKPYNEAPQLIDSFNQIIKEGGRCEICLSNFSTEGHNVLQLKMYRCRNTYAAASLGAKIINTFKKEDLLNITKFNFASTYNCPVEFSLKDSGNSQQGPIICISLFEHKSLDAQNNINQQFALLDSLSK